MPDEAFVRLLGELSDGARWRILSGTDRYAFARRLADELVTLDREQRHAVLLCLFELLAGAIHPADLATHLLGRDLTEERAASDLIRWLQQNE